MELDESDRKILKLALKVAEANSIEEIIKLRNESGLFSNATPSKIQKLTLEELKSAARETIEDLNNGETNGND